ncbi:MAG: MFS transporter, partial [Clostridiales bacterium]|nr:MFS transporter [Clostridiales bacterium]
KPRVDTAPRQKDSLKSTFKSYGELLKSKLYVKCYILTMLGAFLYYAIAVTLVIYVLLIYGNQHYDNFPIFGTITLALLVVNIRDLFESALFVPNFFIMKKFGKHRPFLIDLPILFIGCAILFFVTSATPIWIYLISIAFIGGGVSCLAVIPNALMPDLTDVDELIYGIRREGASAGLISLGKQVVQGLAFLVLGIVLTAFGLSEENASPEKATAASLAAMRLMLCVLPVIGSIAMFFISRKYNLNAKSHNLIKEKIAEKREKGFAVLTAEERRTFTDITGIEAYRLWITESAECKMQNEECRIADNG